MVLKDILSISGQPGLYKFIAQGKNAIVVEHLETKKRSSAFGSAKVSSLEEISVYTKDEDMPLGKVFDLIFDKENGGPAVDYKADQDKLKAYFAEMVPDYDRERVYYSDIRKIIQWYNILHSLEMLVPEPEEKADAEKEGNESESKAREANKDKGSKENKTPAKKAPVKKTPAKKTPSKKPSGKAKSE